MPLKGTSSSDAERAPQTRLAAVSCGDNLFASPNTVRCPNSTLCVLPASLSEGSPPVTLIEGTTELDADAQSCAVSCGDGDEYPIVTLTLMDSYVSCPMLLAKDPR